MKKATIILVFIGLCIGGLCFVSTFQDASGKEKFLFQPMFIWANSEVTHQGTSYMISHDNQKYGITSIHFLNFEVGGLFEAIWLDVTTDRTLLGFKESYGRPLIKEIEAYQDIDKDFLIMPCTDIPDGYSSLELDDREYAKGMKLRFPNKDYAQESGYSWIPAVVEEDHGYMIEVRLLEQVELQSQSGSPFICDDNNKVAGMLTSGNQEGGETILYLCPARSILQFLKQKRPVVPLMESISDG